MNDITLKKIDESNFIECFAMELADGQEKYVSSPVRSLAQAYVYYDQCTPMGIYHGDRMVGYVLVIFDRDEETYNIWHMMIDKRFQGMGCGREGIKQALHYIAAKPFGESRTVLLTCSRENMTAYGLYCSLGFEETGRSDDEEVEMSLTLC